MRNLCTWLTGIIVATALSTATAEVPRRGEVGAPPAVPIPEPAPGEVIGSGSHHTGPVEMAPEAQQAEFDRGKFGPDPSYEDKPYDPKAQLDVYGGKTAVIGPRPPIEWGYPMYQGGAIGPGISLFGDKNPARPEFLVFGDLRLGTAYNDNGKLDTAQIAARLNLNMDLRLTATERFHGFFRPLDRTEKGRVTRYEFGGNQRNIQSQDGEILLDMTPEALFFEGDVGQILAGVTDRYNLLDLPIALGLTPLLFQNGVWMEDAIIGGAVTIPAMNSPKLDISNMDVTFFTGFDRVTTKAVVNPDNKFADSAAEVYGTAIFIERHEGYIEAGYGYTRDTRDTFGGFSYHNMTLAFTKRYRNWLSNSMRVIWNFGQDPGPGRAKTADGWLVLMENSFITRKPYTLLPYANFFVGSNRPQSLARDFGAGGVLKNTGINFETDGLTGFPKLDDTANDTYGGAVGIEYLFNLDQQFVLEAAGLRPFGSDNKRDRVAKGDQFAVGARYQIPLSKRWIFRTDAIYGVREHEDDLAGIRGELRLKF